MSQKESDQNKGLQENEVREEQPLAQPTLHTKSDMPAPLTALPEAECASHDSSKLALLGSRARLALHWLANFTRANRRTKWTATVLVVLIAIGTTYALSYNEGKRSAAQSGDVLTQLPPVPLRTTPLPTVPLLTFKDALNITSVPSGLGLPESSCGTLPKNWLAAENAKPSSGVDMIQFRQSHTPWPEGSAFWLDKISMGCDGSVGIHASLTPHSNGAIDNLPRIFEAIRIGWYGGAGGRIVWKSDLTPLKYFKTPPPKDATRMIETRWPTTIMVSTKGWNPGFYLFVSMLPNGRYESSAPLIIRAPVGTSSLALIHSTLTWSAYNDFGGRSLYTGPGRSPAEKSYQRSRITSLDRPFSGSGNELLFRDVLPFVQLAEKNNINIDQYADTDLDQHPTLLMHYRGVAWSGHPEYWTQTMYNAAIAARNNGVNLCFFGANTAYWRTVLSPSPYGVDRRMTVYREASEDPATSPSEATENFDSRTINKPSSLIDGSVTSAIGVTGAMLPFSVPSWLGVASNTILKTFSKYSEIESWVPGVASPPSVHKLFAGKFTFGGDPQDEEVRYKHNSVAEMDWWSVPSGAVIFNAGINLWSCNLCDSCGMATVDTQTMKAMDTITVNVLKIWSTKVDIKSLEK
jgi:hypothetical protein